MMYAKVVDGAIVARETKTNPISNIASDGGPTWRPIEEEMVAPPYDFDTEVLVRTETIEADRVLFGYRLEEKQLEAAKAARIERVNADAGARILSVMPEYKQRNALALGLEMTITHGVDTTTWPSEAQTAYAAAMASWAYINNIRDASNQAVASINAANSNDDLRAITVTWPNA